MTATIPVDVNLRILKYIFLNFRPREADAQKYYTDARNAGMNHADCLLLYKKCPKGRGIFDSIFHFAH